MSTKVKELNKMTASSPQGPKCQCAYCDPRPDKVGMDKVWAFALANPGVSVWR